MEQPRTLQYVTDMYRIFWQEAFISDHIYNILGNVLSQRFPIGRHLHRMCQPRSDKVTSVQRKHLCLILEPPERGTQYNSMVIFFKLCPQIMRTFPPIASDSVITEQ